MLSRKSIFTGVLFRTNKSPRGGAVGGAAVLEPFRPRGSRLFVASGTRPGTQTERRTGEGLAW
jgi:hypothetical protein